MKTNNLLSRRSFLRTCITYFLLCSLLVFLVNALANALIAARLDRAFPSVDTLLQYGDALAEDDFSAIPHRRLQGCAFLVFDGDDRLLGEEERMLISAAQIGAEEAACEARRLGGAAFPAHVDRDSFSVIASLGAVPAEAGFTAAEVTRDCDLASFTQLHPELGGLPIFRDSDSHYLETLAGDPWELPLPELSIQAVLDAVRGRN